jgi:hypothetical protein
MAKKVSVLQHLKALSGREAKLLLCGLDYSKIKSFNPNLDFDRDRLGHNGWR